MKKVAVLQIQRHEGTAPASSLREAMARLSL